MSTLYQFVGDAVSLLAAAPRAVDSFFAGHWQLMLTLEARAPQVIERNDVDLAASFLADVAFLKRPHTTDRASVKQTVLAHPAEVKSALNALRHIGKLGYSAMDVLAHVPFFGRRGGRSFNSAVLRLVCPASYGVVDWRNVAVLCGSPGFDGLIGPTVSFPQFSREDPVLLRGHLPFTASVYRHYNETLRSLALHGGMRTADVDLVLWTYSIDRQPFTQFSLPVFSSTVRLDQRDREALRIDHQAVATRLAREYLSTLAEAGTLTKAQILTELRSLFTLIRDECAAFGSRKRGKLIKDRVRLVTSALDEAIASDNPERLLGQWNRWQGMVDTASPLWSGISLPTNMILEGYLVLEDFIQVKDYIEAHYQTFSLAPRYPDD
jgi:hypothetical protein